MSLVAGLALGVAAGGLLWSVVQAASSGPNSPSTGTNNSSVGSVAWSSPGNVVASDNSQASASIPVGSSSNYVVATGFGFSVPTDAVIDGIQVDVERKDANTGHSNYVVRDNAVRIVKGGTIGSTDRSSGSDWPTADEYVSYGGSIDQWGESWSPADVNASDFGFAISAQAIRLGGPPNGSETAHIDHVRITVFYSVTAFTQSGYRWFDNTDSTDVGPARAAQNTAATAPDQGTPFRLRALLHVSQAALATSGEHFKLQYAGKGGGSCASPGGTPSSYTDVSGSGAIRYHDNGGAADGAALTANGGDPVHDGHTVRHQTYEESNDFTNSQASIGAGEDGLWDFALVDDSAPPGTAYCFRIVKSDGTPLDTYGTYPEIVTAGGGPGTTVDIVDGDGVPVGSPSFTMDAHTVSLSCEPVGGTFGTSTQRIRVSNGSVAENWNLTLAAAAGPAAAWSGDPDYDFNDPGGSPAGCDDGGDEDSLAGQLTVDPSSGTLAPQGGCSATGVSQGSSAAFIEGSVDDITVLSGTAASDTNCQWDLTGVGLGQMIPAEQPGGSYMINMTLTLTVT